jgi:integrase
VDDDRSDFYPLWFLLSHTGIRRGEAAALLWEDFDAKSGLLWIRRNRVALKNATVEATTPKTKGSKRTLELDAETVQVLDRRHRAAQAKAHLLAGPYWSETGYLFTDKYGQPLHPNATCRLQVKEWSRRAESNRGPLHYE